MVQATRQADDFARYLREYLDTPHDGLLLNSDAHPPIRKIVIAYDEAIEKSVQQSTYFAALVAFASIFEEYRIDTGNDKYNKALELFKKAIFHRHAVNEARDAFDELLSETVPSPVERGIAWEKLRTKISAVTVDEQKRYQAQLNFIKDVFYDKITYVFATNIVFLRDLGNAPPLSYSQHCLCQYQSAYRWSTPDHYTRLPDLQERFNVFCRELRTTNDAHATAWLSENLPNTVDEASAQDNHSDSNPTDDSIMLDDEENNIHPDLQFRRDKLKILGIAFLSSLVCCMLSIIISDSVPHAESKSNNDAEMIASILVPMLPFISALLLIAFKPEQTVAVYRRCNFSHCLNLIAARERPVDVELAALPLGADEHPHHEQDNQPLNRHV